MTTRELNWNVRFISPLKLS